MWGRNRSPSGLKAILGRAGATALAVLAFPVTADAATFTVTSNGDGLVPGTLANAINLANGNADPSNRIEFAVTGTIQLADSLPTITKSIEIAGPGASALTIRGLGEAGGFRVLRVCVGQGFTSIAAAISGVAITNGFDSSQGGGILLSDTPDGDCSLSLNNVIVSGNAVGASSGGAVVVSGGAIATENDTSLAINNSVISGNTASATATGFAGADGGAINLEPTASAEVNNTTISANRVVADSGGGHAVANGGGVNLFADGGNATITNSLISGNEALADAESCCHARAFGGGLAINSGSISNSTISGNRATANGGFPQAFGGFFGGFMGGASLTSVTLADNGTAIVVRTAASGTNNGGANLGGYAELRNTLIADPVGGLSCGVPESSETLFDPSAEPPLSGGNNYDEDGSCQFGAATDISGGDALLGPLADNGGPTLTHELLAGSPAIDAGTSLGLTTDQRGMPRPVQVLEPTTETPVLPTAQASKVNPNGGDGADIGAFERQAIPGPDPVPDSGPNPDQSSRRIHYSLRFKYIDKHGETFVVARVFCHSVGCNLEGSGKIKILPFPGRKGIDRKRVFKIGEAEGGFSYVAGRQVAGKLRFKVSQRTATAVKKAIVHGARGRVRATVSVTGANQVQPDAVKKRFRNIKLFARSRVNKKDRN